MSHWSSHALFACLLIAALLLPGCVTPQQVEAFRNQAQELSNHLQAETRAWEERLAKLDPGSPMAADTRAALERSRAQQAAAQAAIEQLDLVVHRATSPESPLAQAVNDLSPWLPAPARLPLALGAALALSLARGVQLKRGLVSIAQGFQKAIEEDDAFASRFRAHANTFRTIQTPAARKAVDEVTGSRLLRLPI